MPLYEFQCDVCAHRFEVIQKFTDPPPAACPKCGSPVTKLMSSPAIQFKGSGFYLTDYGRSGGKGDNANANAKGGKSEGGSGGGEGASSDSKASDGKSSDSKASDSKSSSEGKSSDRKSEGKSSDGGSSSKSAKGDSGGESSPAKPSTPAKSD